MSEGFASYPTVSFSELAEKIDAALPGLPTQEARLAQFMLLNIDKLALETGRTLAAKVGVSEVTVGRLLRRLGCDGMRGLKAMMREQYSLSAGARPMAGGEAPAMNDRLERVLGAEIDALHSIFQQAGSNAFRELAKRLAEAQGVYVTGFQSVRGIAEDCARRLAIARPNVRYLSAHDSMLAEWLLPSGEGGDRPEDTCLLLIDVVPYARESQDLARIARDQGRRCVVVTDEYCHWAKDVADAVLHAPSRSGLFLESTVGIVSALNLVVDGVAGLQDDGGRQRIDQWKLMARDVRLF
ncbi:MurR/RpiR family transcriptional regulator [Stappia sp. MMSF_3263]|uniref:MurR/RpiR family transcriptional regulator n=1 Tax=Stappia sp. MMSF_3263 TaxID=3046693 RepID=UPI00273EEE2F|nr:MurR/RpiR family transcriptional regulator [Stappia sp. MMSF_3263]